MATYIYWWSTGALKCPGRANIPHAGPPAGLFPAGALYPSSTLYPIGA